MIKAGTGLSREPSAERAARQAGEAALEQARIGSADLVICFASSHHSHEYRTLLSAISSVAGTENVVGCSGMGALSSEGEAESSISLSVLAIRGVEATPFLAVIDEEKPREFAEDLLRQVESPSSPGSTVLMLVDPIRIDVLGVVDTLRKGLEGVTLVGAAASTMSLPPKTYQWSGLQVVSNGVAGVVFPPGLRTTVGVAQACKPIGNPYVITKAHGNVLLEIGNLPAAEVLHRALQSLAPEEAKRASGNVFAGLAADERKHPLAQGDFLVRHIVGIDQRYSAIAISDRVQVGQTIQFQIRDPQAARGHFLDTIGRLAESVSPLHGAFGLYFDCIGRGEGLYGVPHHDTGVIGEKFPALPVAGLFSNAEIGPVHGRNSVHIYSGVLALFHEEEVSQA